MRVDDAQLDVRQRAHRQRHRSAPRRGPRAVVLDAAHAVVDALDAGGRRAPARCTRAGLPRPRARPRAAPRRARASKTSLELLRRVAGSPGVEADADEMRPGTAAPASSVAQRVGLGRWRRKHRISCDVIASSCSPRASARPDPVDDRLDRDAAGGVGLRVEEDLGVPHALSARRGAGRRWSGRRSPARG